MSSAGANAVPGPTPALGWNRSALLAAAGGTALAMGILVYLTDRSASPVLLPRVAALAGRQLFGMPGQWLPSFVHALAFGLLTAVALRPTAATRHLACAAWCAVNIAFEAGQHPALKSWWSGALDARAGDWIITRSVLNYFIRGTFDWSDACAAIVGALAAAALLRIVDRHRESHHAAH